MFRDAPSTGVKQIEFTDAVLERAGVLDVSLGLIVHNRLNIDKYEHIPHETDDKPPPIPDGQLNVFSDVISFLHKWDCAAALRAFGLCVLELLVLRRVRPIDALVLGMLSKDAELCAAALSRTIGCRGWQVAHLPLNVIERADPRFLWAMGMACAPPESPNEIDDIDDVGLFFLIKLQLAERQNLSQ